ncbi:MAG: hypothetical protein PHQ98_02165 [Candidatus ainarchaeum sp.]|nr:hypothetical protein [Candidatus ainarchaeum sp.]
MGKIYRAVGMDPFSSRRKMFGEKPNFRKKRLPTPKVKIKVPKPNAIDLILHSKLSPREQALATEIILELQKNNLLGVEELSLNLSKKAKQINFKLNNQGTTQSSVVTLYRKLITLKIIHVGPLAKIN